MESSLPGALMLTPKLLISDIMSGERRSGPLLILTWSRVKESTLENGVC
jgi:hypothetical protein